MNDNLNGSSNELQIGKVIGGKFKLEDKIGQGSFGMIFKCINIETQETSAIKLEKRNAKHQSMLVREIKVMMEVKNEKGFARLVGYGKEDEYNYVAMSYLGRNLDSLLKKCGGKLQMSCVINVFEQCIKLLRVLHSKNLIHRDIKPENFVIGYGQIFNVVHLIDFGLAKFYIDSDGNHIPFFAKKGMIGTARYASLNAHLGFEQSRRDDLEVTIFSKREWICDSLLFLVGLPNAIAPPPLQRGECAEGLGGPRNRFGYAEEGNHP